MVETIKGDLIQLALAGKFDVIAHGCNCFCKQTSGIAKEMVANFQTDKFYKETTSIYEGDHNKLGTIDVGGFVLDWCGNPEICEESCIPSLLWNQLKRMDLFVNEVKFLEIVNCYTQFRYGKNHVDGDNDPFNAMAIEMCLIKLNHHFANKHIGLPYIGCGLASPKHLIPERKVWFENTVKQVMIDCDVTIVEYQK